MRAHAAGPAAPPESPEVEAGEEPDLVPEDDVSA